MGAISPADVACTITQGHNVNKGTSPSKNSMCSSILGSNEAKMGYDGDITWYNQHVMQIWWDIGRTWIYDSNSPTWGWAVWRIQFRLLQWLYTIIPMISQWYHQFGIIDDFFFFCCCCRGVLWGTILPTTQPSSQMFPQSLPVQLSLDRGVVICFFLWARPGKHQPAYEFNCSGECAVTQLSSCVYT